MPDLTILSLGAGVQSTTLALLAAEGALPAPDVAIFADTGWEPAEVYEHLDRLERAVPFEVVRVQQGDLRAESIDPSFGLRLPLFVRHPGRNRIVTTPRQCTPHYKVRPIQTETRRRLGATVTDAPCRYCEGSGRRVAPWLAKRGEDTVGTCSVCGGSGRVERVGNPPAGSTVEQWVGFSTDEIGRVSESRIGYIVNRFPLLELDMSRNDCLAWLAERGWDSVAKSACIGCPFHGNRAWRDLRDHRPDEWQDAVAFDRSLREGTNALDHPVYLHRSGMPLDQAPIDLRSRREWQDAQVTIEQAIEAQLVEDGDPDGCSPYGCRSGEPVEGGEP